MNIPECANYLAKSCERSDTIVERDTGEYFVIRCRTCKGINVWPYDRDDRHARYQAFMKHQADLAAAADAQERRTLYSIPGMNPGAK